MVLEGGHHPPDLQALGHANSGPVCNTNNAKCHQFCIRYPTQKAAAHDMITILPSLHVPFGFSYLLNVVLDGSPLVLRLLECPQMLWFANLILSQGSKFAHLKWWSFLIRIQLALSVDDE